MKERKSYQVDRMRAVCRKLGNPEKGLNIIYVTGTNGKGSTCAMMEAVFRAAGYKTGLFTSPHLIDYSERIRINGVNIAQGDYQGLKEKVDAAAKSMRLRLSGFGTAAAVALSLFQREGCGVVIMEAGVGGAADAANVMEETLLSIITNVTIDHSLQLGATAAEIAGEKAGIIKTGCPVLFGGVDEEAEQVIRERARALNAPYTHVDYGMLSVQEMDMEGTRFVFGGRKDVQIHLLGSYQPRNAAVVLTAVDILRERGMELPEEAVRRGLEQTRWPARFELLCRDPLVIFDGGHNEAGVAAAVESVKEYFGGEKVYVLSGVYRDKRFRRMAPLIALVAQKVFAVKPENIRALDAQRWAGLFRDNGVEAEAFDNVEEGVSAALEAAEKDSRSVLCVGTFSTYAQIMSEISKKELGEKT